MYRPLVESLDEIQEEDIDPLGALGDVKTFSFAGFSALQEATKVNTLVTPEPEATPTTSLRVDAPVFQPITTPLAVEVTCSQISNLRAEAPVFQHITAPVLAAPLVAQDSSVLCTDAAVFIPATSTVGPYPTLRTEAPTFKPRNALALAYSACTPSDASTSRDALQLARASRLGFVTPRHVLRLEAPGLNNDAPVFVPRITVSESA